MTAIQRWFLQHGIHSHRHLHDKLHVGLCGYKEGNDTSPALGALYGHGHAPVEVAAHGTRLQAAVEPALALAVDVHLPLFVTTLEHTFLSWLSFHSLTLSCPALFSLLVSIFCFPPFPTECFLLLDKEALCTKNSPKLETVPKVSQGPPQSRA